MATDTDPLSDPIAAYEAAYRWLFGLVTDPQGQRFFQEKSRETRRQEMAEGMARLADFLAFCGDPQRRFRSVHVAGTSGKGSVTHLVSQLLQQAGKNVGEHTSPYLQTPLEKLVHNGRWLPPSRFTQLVEHFKTRYAAWQQREGAFDRLKYGEAWVALTFLWLAEAHIDFGVVETGMGGRFDPTNLLPAELSIITNVAYDHEKFLGPTLADIAWHKAGIIKPGRPVVTGVRDPALLAIIEAEAEAQGAPLYRLGREFDFEQMGVGQLRVRTPEREVVVATGGRRGFQQLNGVLALTAADLLGHLPRHPSLDLPPLAGRMEVMQTNPLVVIDGAHNPHKMAALVDSFSTAYPQKRPIAVVGAIVNKDAGELLAALLPLCREMILTEPRVPGKPAIPTAELAQLVHKIDPTIHTHCEPYPQAALDLSLNYAQPDDCVLITGSIYLIGDLRGRWHPLRPKLEALEAAVDPW